MTRLFGTDGVRGVANTELTPELAFALGYYGARVLAHGLDHQPRFVVGMDTRRSGPLMEHALCAGICAAGADAYLCGVIPTPGIAFLTADRHFDAGVMISASHNPYPFNGIKFFNSEGYKLPDAVEDEIEDYIQGRREDKEARPEGAAVGTVHSYPQGPEHYFQHLRYAMGLDLSGHKIAMDCAHGAAYDLGPRLFRQLGADLVVIGDTPDGLNINEGVGSTHLEALIDLVRREGCELGIAYDGDADRMLAVDAQGRVADGDVIMAILARYLRSKQQLKEDCLVVTVMSNLGLFLHAKETGLKLVTTKVGDRYVLEEMRKSGYTLGGEQSGHVILSDYATTGDGILSSLALLKSLRKAGESLEEASQLMKVLPQVLLPAHVPNPHKNQLMEAEAVQEHIREVSEKLGERGRVLVRPSGTEPMIRVMLEGEDLEEIRSLAEALVETILESERQLSHEA